MKYSKLIFASAIVTSLSITSCSNDSDDTIVNYTIPTTYTFERNNTTSVDYSGQSSRLLMLEEMGNYIKTAATAGTIVDNVVLSNMYSNTNNPFSTTELNTSGKQLKNKTAASKDYFELFLGGGSTVEKTNVQAFLKHN